MQDAITKVNWTFHLQCVCPKSTQDAIRDEAMGCVFGACQASDVVKAQKASAVACVTFTLIVEGDSSLAISAAIVRPPIESKTTGAAISTAP